MRSSSNSRHPWLIMTPLTSDTLEYYGQFAAQGKLSGNERVVWHGTRRACSLGETGRTTPCMIPRCSLCSIIRGSLDPDRSTPILPPGSGRLGTGIYTSTKSSRYINSRHYRDESDADLRDSMPVGPTTTPVTTKAFRRHGRHCF